MTARSRRRRSGLTLAEVLVVLCLVALLAGLFVAGYRPPERFRDRARRVRCMNKLRQTYMGLRLYLNNFEEIFPLAWHVGGEAMADDLGNVSYHRFDLLEHIDNAFRRTVSRRDLDRNDGNVRAAQREKFHRTFEFWKCPAAGWTNDHFAPEIIFRMPEKPGKPYDKHAVMSELFQDVPATDRPVFSDVNASFPDPKAMDINDRGHEEELRKGFSCVRAAGIDVYVGVGASLRKLDDPATSRLDFRHSDKQRMAFQPGDLANVIFLDGHVATVKRGDQARLRRLHACWNHLKPPEGR